MRYKIANILFGGSVAFSNYPALCYRTVDGCAWKANDADVLRIAPHSHIDFTTYFNALSVMKWKRYSVATEYFLSFDYRGGGFRSFKLQRGVMTGLRLSCLTLKPNIPNRRIGVISRFGLACWRVKCFMGFRFSLIIR